MLLLHALSGWEAHSVSLLAYRLPKRLQTVLQDPEGQVEQCQ